MITFAREGWVCPKCGRVYSPFTIMCYYCGNSDVTVSTNTNTEDRRYCERNICMENEYNGIECDECEVTKHNKKMKEVKK